MKKIISLLLILVMLISFSACKRAKDIDDEEIAVAGGESDKVIDSTPEEQEQEVQTPTENTEQKDAQTPTESTAQKQEEQTPAEDTQKQEQSNTEAQKPVEQTPTVTLKYPELQALNQQLQKEFGLENKGYPTDVYLQEYLPLKLGHVTKETVTGKSYFYRAKEDFVTREPITEQMLEAAKQYPYGVNEGAIFDYCNLNSVIPDGGLIYSRNDFDSTLEYLEKLLEVTNAFIIKGHFEASYGTAYAYYNVKSGDPFTYSNYATDRYTLYNFVIEKVYTDNCEYKAGDTIELALEGTVLQQPEGFYRADTFSDGIHYINFKNATLEERTFVLSVNPKTKKSGIMTLGRIRQNVYEDIPDIDNDRHNLSREILAKYN